MILKNIKDLDDSYRIKAIEEELKIKGDSFVLINESTLSYLLLNDDNLLIGGVDVGYALDECEIYYLYIKEEYRHKSNGSILMDLLLKDLSLKGIKNVFLDVRTKNTYAIKLYEKHNFKRIGIRKRYYEDGDDAIVMVKTIEA
ncbi:MAG: GNAT family N-acetyltransferase [Gammaproteobacteria bacterium]|nr:GNAT family N-acetyltransferase [Gammaproteobacteria bacterium]